MMCLARLTLALSIILSGCASTKVNSLASPEISPAGYKRILVAFPVPDLRLRRLTEDAFPAGNLFVPSYSVLFPREHITQESLSKALADNRIDAVLILSVENAGEKHVRMPTNTTAQCTFYGPRGCTSASAVTTGGGDLSKPWAAFSAKLFDVTNGRVVWVASANSKGNAFAKVDDLLRSMAEATLFRLVDDRVIR